MKILMLTDNMDMGGAETHIRDLILGLQSMGAEVHLMSGGGRLADMLEQDGIRQLRTSLFCRRPVELLVARRRIRQLVKQERYDILHAHARIPALLLRGCHRWGCRSVVTVHARFQTNRFLSRLCFWGQHTIAVSEDLRSYVCDLYGLPAERVSVIANGVDCKRFLCSSVERRESMQKILFASRLDGDSSLGAMLLCEIAPTLCRTYPALEITIAGGGSCLEAVRQAAERVNHLLRRSAVKLAGRVEDMAPLLRAHDIFVGVSRAAMEAAACGCAVVLCGNEGYGGIMDADTARVSRLSNFCCREGSGARAEWLERDLRRLIEQEDVRRSCADVGRALMESDFNADDMCRKTLEIYHRERVLQKASVLTIGGYFGCGNIGDDAILLGFLELMHELAPRVEVQALTRRPDRNCRRFGITCIDRRNPIAVRSAFLRSHAFLCGGGSLLQNATSDRSLRYYLGLLRAARHCGCHTLLFAGGIGPLLGRRAGEWVRRELSRCRYLSLRDTESLRYLRRLGIRADRLHESADPALFLPLPPAGRAEAILLEQGVPARKDKLFCVVLRGGREYAVRCKTVITAVRVLCQQRDLIPILPILDEKEDGAQTRIAAELLGGYAITLREPSDLTALLSVSLVALTMRLHAMILAGTVALPVLSVAPNPHDRKIAAFARASGQEYIDAERLSVGEIVEALELCIESRQTRAPILRDAILEMRKKTRKDIANILEMIYNMDKKL